MANVTFKRVCNGIFETYVDGVKTDWEIVNGSLGLSGNDRNVYGINNTKSGSIKWLGPLRTCKKTLELTLAKKKEVTV